MEGISRLNHCKLIEGEGVYYSKMYQDESENIFVCKKVSWCALGSTQTDNAEENNTSRYKEDVMTLHDKHSL